MSREPIILRVDATRQSGYERLARCTTLAAALQRRRRPVYFLSQLEPNSLAMGIKRGGNNWVLADHPAGSEEDVNQMLSEIARLKPAAVYVDAADVSHDYLAEVASTNVLLAAIDHSATVRFPTKLLINPLLAPNRDSYEFDNDTQLLLGRRFAMVRPEVRRQRQTRSQEPPPVAVANGTTILSQYRVLLALGEDDPNRMTMDLAQLLVNAPRIGKVDIVIRREHPQLEEIKEMVEANKEVLTLALEPAEIANRITRCHFALTSGSGWSLELACVGVPQLLLLQNELHWPNAQRLEDEGAASVLGWHENVSAQTIRQGVQNLITDALERKSMARCGRKLIDGRGPDRLVNAMEILLSPAQQTEPLRLAA
ncbi:MAG: polysaccharide biosynthesis protein [Planctomycetes bacterium]|nr:polysaccharide biosynthesis protein [Planctomycetota bacterium]